MPNSGGSRISRWWDLLQRSLFGYRRFKLNLPMIDNKTGLKFCHVQALKITFVTCLLYKDAMRHFILVSVYSILIHIM